MAGILTKNNAASTLATAIGTVDTTIALAAGTGDRFPAITGGNWFYLTLVAATTGVVEIVRINARVADTLTVVRAQDGTVASAFALGTVVEMRLTSAVLAELYWRTFLAVANGVAPLDGTSKVPIANLPAFITQVDADARYILQTTLASLLTEAEAVGLYVPLTQRGLANGVATLDGSGFVPDAQISAAITRDAEAVAAYLPKASPAYTGTLTGAAATLSGALNGTTAALSGALTTGGTITVKAGAARGKLTVSASAPSGAAEEGDEWYQVT